MATKEAEIKINIKKSKRGQKGIKDISGPIIGDIHKKTSRWKKLPVKNIIKIKDGSTINKSKNKLLFRGLVFVFIGLVVGAAVLGYVYLRYFSINNQAASLVPYESSIYGKVNMSKLVSFKDSQEQVALDGRMDFTGNYFINIINEEIFKYGLDFSDDIKAFLGEEMSFSYIDSGEDSGFVFLNQVIDVGLAQNNINKAKYKSDLKEENYEDIKIYNFFDNESDSSLYVTFIDDYLVVSRKRFCVTAVIDTYQNKRLNLAQNKDFKSILPLFLTNEILYIYAKPGEITELFNQENNIFTIWSALNSKMDVAFIALREVGGGLLIDARIEGGEYKYKEGISKELYELLPAETSGFIAGQNLSQDIDELKSELKESNPALEFHLDDFLRNIEEKAKIDDVDLLSLFKKEFLLSFDYTGDKINYNIITKLGDNDQALETMNAFEEAVANYYGDINPRKQKMILSDGSEATELLPDPESYAFSDIDFDGKKARGVISENLDNNISYVVDDNNVVIISTSLGSLKNIFSTTSENDKLSNKRYFSYPLSQVSKRGVSNIFYINTKDLQDYFKFDNLLGKTASLFDDIIISVQSKKGIIHLKSFLYLE